MESRINTTPGWQDPTKASCSKAADGLFVAGLVRRQTEGPCEEEGGLAWFLVFTASDVKSCRSHEGTGYGVSDLKYRWPADVLHPFTPSPAHKGGGRGGLVPRLAEHVRNGGRRPQPHCLAFTLGWLQEPFNMIDTDM